MTIFYADDDQDDLDIFQEPLKLIDEKIKVTTFTFVPDVVNHLQRMAHLPDYIFLDVNMMPIDGKKCLKQIKNDNRLKDIPVYMLSTGDNPNEVEYCLNLGATEYVKKQCTIPKLANQLKEILTDK